MTAECQQSPMQCYCLKSKSIRHQFDDTSALACAPAQSLLPRGGLRMPLGRLACALLFVVGRSNLPQLLKDSSQCKGLETLDGFRPRRWRPCL
jgi:hypothetical protein